MQRSRLLILAVLVLSLTLVASVPCRAADFSIERSGGAWGELLGSLVHWLEGTFAESGLCIDPNGRPTPCAGAGVSGESGGCIDPDGRPKPCAGSGVSVTTGESGLCIDPDGRPAPCAG
jgi:hypothetical protein